MQKKDTIWNPVFISVFIANICQQMGQQMMNTLIPKFADSLGAPAALVGFVSSSFAITALVIRPFSGPAFDSFSKRRLLLAAQLCVFSAFIGYGFADNIEMVIACRLLHGIGAGCCTPLFLAMASNSLPDHLLGSGIGIFSLGQAVAQAIGPTVGLSMSNAIGYNNSFFVGAVIMAIAATLSFMIKEEPDPNRPKYKIALNRIVAKGAIKPSIIMFFLGMSYACISSFLAIYGGERGVEQIGLFFTAYAGTMLITRPVCGKLVDKYGFDKVLIPGILCFAASFILIGFSRSLAGFIFAGVVGACGYGVCQPTIQSLCMRCTPKSQRGAAGNTNYIGMDCGMLCGPLVAGFVVDTLTELTGNAVQAYSSMYFIMTIPMLVALVYFILVKGSIKKDIEELDAAAAKAAAETASGASK